MREQKALARELAQFGPDPLAERLRVELTKEGAGFFDKHGEVNVVLARFGRIGLRIWFTPWCPPELRRPIAAHTLNFRHGTQYVAVDGHTYTWGGLPPSS